MQQERLNCGLDYLEMAIAHTDVDDNPISITFDTAIMQLDAYILTSHPAGLTGGTPNASHR